MKPHSFSTLSILLLVLFLGAPYASPAGGEYWPDAQWRTATPESQGMRSEILADMLARLGQKNHGLDSILIVRNGYAVLDTYHFPKTPDRKHDLYSCTKSVSSTLIGIAIDKGYIQSVDQPLLDFFPDKSPPKPDERKQQITLEDVLQMTTGLECRDSIFYQWAGLMEHTVFRPTNMSAEDLKDGHDWITNRFYSLGRILLRAWRSLWRPNGLHMLPFFLSVNLAYYGRVRIWRIKGRNPSILKKPAGRPGDAAVTNKAVGFGYNGL